MTTESVPEEAKKPLFVDLNPDSPEEGIIEVESLCSNCEDQVWLDTRTFGYQLTYTSMFCSKSNASLVTPEHYTNNAAAKRWGWFPFSQPLISEILMINLTSAIHI